MGSGKPKLVRGDLVVRRVLDATLQELAKAGYQSLRMEDVAARAEVNKTTVYRRWPTKKDLVRSALLKLVNERAAEFDALPDTGSLRGDLLAAARFAIRTMQRPDTESLFRISAVSHEPDLIAIGKSIQAHRRALFRGIFERAKMRGESSGDIESMMLLLDMIKGALISKMLLEHETPDEKFVTRVVDVLLYGALQISAVPSRRMRRG